MTALLAVGRLLLDARIPALGEVILAIDDKLACIKELELGKELLVVLEVSSSVVDG